MRRAVVWLTTSGA